MAIDDFLEELKDCMVEHSFTSRWSLIEGYHLVGSMIIAQGNTYGQNLVGQVATYIGKSERTIRYCVQMATKYPSLDELPEGKNISWGKLIKKYIEGADDSIPRVKILKCPSCGHSWVK